MFSKSLIRPDVAGMPVFFQDMKKTVLFSLQYILRTAVAFIAGVTYVTKETRSLVLPNSYQTSQQFVATCCDVF